jgi:hypothetical protein
VNKQYEELLLDQLHETCFRNTGLGMTILGTTSLVCAHDSYVFIMCTW